MGPLVIKINAKVEQFLFPRPRGVAIRMRIEQRLVARFSES